MSSSLRLYLDQPADLRDWLTVCRKHKIVYSPNTVGGNVFYRGRTEIALECDPALATGASVPMEGREGPPARFVEISIGSFHGTGYSETGEIARAVAKRFACRVSCDPELAAQVVGIPRYIHPWDIDAKEFLSTDADAGWSRDGDTLLGRVNAGTASLRPDGDLVALDVDGVRVACFRSLDDGMLFAGRFSFDWWTGPSPRPHGDLRKIA